jgi:hypothetical protein
MSITEEIQHAELQRYSSKLTEELEVVCRSSAFRTSPKSCEFLRHIVRHTLDDDIAQLKERLIGMVLLGREATYDTGSDAGVRVRANDVRKRLIAHYKTPDADTRFTFELPAGSYVPRFFRTVPSAKLAVATKAPDASRIYCESAPPLPLQWLAAPTLVALFLCAICLRWQVAQEHPFTSFWQNVFRNHHVTLYLSPSKTDRGEDLVAMQELKAADPLFDLAGQFHTRFTLTSSLSASASSGDILVSIGPIADHTAGTSSNAIEEAASVNGNRLAVVNTPTGRRIYDRDSPDSFLPASGHAALLTISNGAQRSIQIDGTDDDAIESLVEILCERDTFPAGLADSFQEGAITQVVFPLSPRAQAMLFHEPLPLTQNKMAELR